MLTTAEKEKYKKELTAERDKLMRQIEADSSPANQGNDVTLPGEEEADEAEDLSNQLAIAQTLRSDVQEIDEALERIRDGQYGICKNCGKSIPKKVLDAAPESLLCEDCKQAI